MPYEIIAIDMFQKDVKQDVLTLIETLEKDFTIGTHLGDNLYR